MYSALVGLDFDHTLANMEQLISNNIITLIILALVRVQNSAQLLKWPNKWPDVKVNFAFMLDAINSCVGMGGKNLLTNFHRIQNGWSWTRLLEAFLSSPCHPEEVAQEHVLAAFVNLYWRTLHNLSTPTF